MSEKITKTDEEWKKELSPDEYEVCRQKGTERAFTGMYWDCLLYTSPSPRDRG